MAGENSGNGGNSNSSLAFIVGGLVVAVGIIAYLFFGDGMAIFSDGGAGTSISVETNSSGSSEAPAAAPAGTDTGAGSTDTTTTDTTTTTTTGN